MTTTEIPLDERIRTFAESVRAHLDDLPADEVEEIITGLTADLAEQAADDGGVLDLGDSTTYAAELRAAAGLPERTDAAKREPLRTRMAARGRAMTDSIRRSAFGAWLLDLLVSLRPVWWVLRGYGMFAITAVLFGFINSGYGGWFVPENLIEWIALMILVIVSVQWGRGKWLPQNPLRHMRTVFSILAVVMLPVALGSMLTPRVEYVDSGVYVEPGLLLDGVQVGNVFAYDENGELIESVQLYTDNGTPLDLYGLDAEANGIDYGWKDGAPVLPFTDARGQSVWNVYPLREGTQKSDAKPAAPPFLRAPGLLTPAPTPTPSPADSPVVTTPAPATPAPSDAPVEETPEP